MALVVAMAGMMLPAISVKAWSIMIALKFAPLFDKLTLDIEFRFELKVEDSSSQIGCCGNEVQSIHIIFIECQDRGILVWEVLFLKLL